MNTGSGVRSALATLVVALIVIAAVIWLAARLEVQGPVPEEPASGTGLPSTQAPHEREPGATLLMPGATPPGEMGIDPRSIMTHTVAVGADLFSIAQQFGLQAETVYWANERQILASEAISPRAGTVLLIPPADGVYHEWAVGERLEQVADRYGVSMDQIIAWPQNRLQPGGTADTISETLTSGALLFIPGGRPQLASLPPWVSLGLSRADPGPGAALGPGSCDHSASGVMGTGSLAWPLQSGSILSYDSQGPTLFIAGLEGAIVLAADSGVVLFAGQSHPGPAQAVILDHGSGRQTYYGNLAEVSVVCGESVRQGAALGSLSTRDTRGATLQFEVFAEGRVAPLEVLPGFPE